MEPQNAENRTIKHNGRTVKVDGCGLYTITENGKEIGEFVFSDGHNGLAGFSNSFGSDCYLPLSMNGKSLWGSGPMCGSIRKMVCIMLDKANVEA